MSSFVALCFSFVLRSFADIPFFLSPTPTPQLAQPRVDGWPRFPHHLTQPQNHAMLGHHTDFMAAANQMGGRATFPPSGSGSIIYMQPPSMMPFLPGHFGAQSAALQTHPAMFAAGAGTGVGGAPPHLPMPMMPMPMPMPMMHNPFGPFPAGPLLGGAADNAAPQQGKAPQGMCFIRCRNCSGLSLAAIGIPLIMCPFCQTINNGSTSVPNSTELPNAVAATAQNGGADTTTAVVVVAAAAAVVATTKQAEPEESQLREARDIAQTIAQMKGD